MPYEAPLGQVSSVQVVSNGTPGNLRPLNVSASDPTLLVWPSSVIPGSYAIAVNLDDSLVLPSPVSGFTTHPAKPGDTLRFIAKASAETIPARSPALLPAGTDLEAIQNVTVTLGGVFSGNSVTVPAFFAGLTPTAVGLYQVDVTLPPNVPLGAPSR